MRLTIRSSIGRLGTALLFGLSFACASGAASAKRDGESAHTTIDIENQDFNDMTIYVLDNGQPTRIGIATALKTTTLSIPPYLINGTSYLRFEARPLAGNRSPVSEEIDVTSGDALVMIINPGG